MAATAITVNDYHKLPGGIAADNSAYVFPQIDSVNSHGKVISWRIIVKVFKMDDTVKLPIVENFLPFDSQYLDNKPLPADIYGYIYVESKVADGKIKKIVPTIINKGLNKGKANETNTVCQALRDALSKHNKQFRKAKAESLEVGQTERYPPMLAQVLRDQKDPLDFEEPVFVQCKYNGLRAVFTLDKIDGKDVCIAYSRTKLLYPGFEQIKAELLPILQHYWSSGTKIYFDGELYKHGMNLQDISGVARRGGAGAEALDFMVYDCFIANKLDMLYEDRNKLLTEIFDNIKTTHTIQVPTYQVENQEALDAIYKKFLDEKYEGAMVRLNAKYAFSYNSYHSKVLLKMKPSYDAEYEIIGWKKAEKGKSAGAFMIICKTDEGGVFNVTPALGDDSITTRMELSKKMETVESNNKTHFENAYLGKRVIVEFDEKSKDNIPQRARTALIIRDWD